MTKRIKMISLVSLIWVALLLGTRVYSAFQNTGSDFGNVENQGMPIPGFEEVDESIVNQGMPVPGMEGVEETIVTQGMPVPGLEGVEEMIVGGE